MADIAKLQKIFNAALKQAGEESSMLLGQSLSIEDSDAVQTNRMTYFADTEDAMFVVGVETREDYPGQFHMIFSLRDAILLSSMLLGIPPARISEKRKLAIMEPDDYDAFGEIMNQVIGSFNSVMKPRFPSKIHLKLLGSLNKFVPQMDQLTDEEPIPEGEYVMFRAQLQMDGLEMDRVDIFIPVALAETMMPQAAAPPPPEVVEEAAEEAAEAEPEAVAAGDAAVAVEPVSVLDQTVVILDDDAADRQNVKNALSGAGINLVEASLNDDVRELFTQGKAKVALIGVADTEDRELALCIKINSFCQDQPVPIIMCARQWTRTAVLKALKYGARDIIVKPYAADELVSKVRKFLQAA